jgi:hypothetical protein
MELGCRGQEPAASGAGETAPTGDHRLRHIRHLYPPAAGTVRLDRQDGVVDHRRDHGEHPAGPQPPHPPGVAGRLHDPVTAAVDVLDDQGLTVGQPHPLQQRAGLAVGDHRAALDDRVEQAPRWLLGGAIGQMLGHGRRVAAPMAALLQPRCLAPGPIPAATISQPLQRHCHGVTDDGPRPIERRTP